MLKFFTKQFLYGRIYLWLKPRLSGIFFCFILIILVFYIHNEYLNYIEFKSKNDGNYIGASFLIKNFLIFSIFFGYIYFYKTINKTEKSINKTHEILKEDSKKNEAVTSLDEFLSDEEIDK